MSVREKDNRSLYKRIQEQNLLRQYDLLSNCIEIGIEKGIESFDKYTLWALNHVAVANIAQFGGRFREQPIYVGNHNPPHFEKVPNAIDQMLSVIHENWTVVDHPTAIAAYALWRLNWIHPFVEGNGRTARAACYYLICLKSENCYEERKLCRSASAKTERLITQDFRPLIELGIWAITIFLSSRITFRLCLRRNLPTTPLEPSHLGLPRFARNEQIG